MIFDPGQNTPRLFHENVGLVKVFAGYAGSEDEERPQPSVFILAKKMSPMCRDIELKDYLETMTRVVKS